MSGNSGAWGVALWKDGQTFPGQENGISLEGGDAIVPYLPTVPVGSLLLPPDGMGVPPVRNGDVVLAQRDGVVQVADYYEPRILTFQVSVDGDGCPGCEPEVSETFLALDGVSPGRATTVNEPNPALNVAEDLQVTVHLTMDDWTPGTSAAPVSKWTTSPTQDRSWTTRVNTSGTLGLFWSEDGTATISVTSTTVLPAVDGEDMWLRYTLDVDNGAGGNTVTFEMSDDGVNWEPVGDPRITAGVTTIYPSEAPIIVGAYNNGGSERFAGDVFYAEVRQGPGGDIIVSPDFTEQGVGTIQFQDDQSNMWLIAEPAVIAAAPADPPPMSARQKAARLTQEWSRNCSGATLVLFTDCHNPDATEEEKIYNGPYLVHGRPRVAEVTWRRSNIGGADVLLRFDAADARLVLAQTSGGGTWTGEQTLFPSTNENLAPDPDLSDATMTLNGATVSDSWSPTGGPNGASYFSRLMIASNTTSPMSMALSPSGTGAIPVDPADVLSVAWWTRKDPGGGPAARLDWTWYTAAGAVISAHNGSAQPATATWNRVMQENIVAPALAEFVQFRIVWSGTGQPGQLLEFAQVWINEGATSTAPLQIEAVGTLCVFPVFELTNDLTAPIVITYGPHQFTYNEDILTNPVTIDTRYGRAVQSGLDVTQNLTGDYSSPLEPGVHDVQIQTADPADNGTLSVRWENATVSG